MHSTKLIFVSGNFNILHPGHLRLLRFAKELGGKLVVGVNSDELGGDAVHIPQELRLEGVSSNNWVDEAIILDVPAAEYISHLKPDIVVKGKEFEGANNPEFDVVHKYGGKLVFSSGETTFSSLDLIKQNLTEVGVFEFSYAKQFADRHSFEFEELTSIVNRFSQLKVCVIGDLIVDEYITCEPLGMSQEDPSIVVTPLDSQKFIGGAGIVAAHAAGLGANVTFYSVSGDDDTASYAKKVLHDYKVKTLLFPDESRHTTLKQRYRAHNKTMLRVSHLTQTSINKHLQNKIVDKLNEEIGSYDLIVFSDFNYGVLPQELVDRITCLAKKHKIITVADSQCSSQVGDISRFKGMDLITPTEREARISLKNQEDGLVVIAQQLKQEARAKNVMLKLGAEGVLLLMGSNDKQAVTDKLSALNLSPVDVAGAGDSMLISFGLAFAIGATHWQSALLSCIASAIQVGRLGNTPLTHQELLAKIPN